MWNWVVGKRKTELWRIYARFANLFNRQKVKTHFLCGKAAFCYAKPAFGCPAAFGLVPG
jgi:hypothetical protein